MTTTDPASQAMQTITEQFYNALTSQAHLNPQQFQLAQGNVALGFTSEALWSMMDIVPNTSIVQTWSPGNFNSFSSNFGSILARIQSSAGGAFTAALGDWSGAWTKYISTHVPDSLKDYPTVFQNWAMSVGMDPGTMKHCESLLLAAMDDPISQAQMMWLDAGGNPATKAYTADILTTQTQIDEAPGGSVTLNSGTQSSNVQNTWANGNADGFFNVFFGGGSGSYSDQTVELAAAAIEMSIEFTHIATVAVTPLASGTQTDGPTTYPAWYVASALGTAYENDNYQIWQPGSPGWADFFGEDGTLQNVATALVVVDGIAISLTSQASINTSSQQAMQTAFEAGFFPFFGVEGQGGWNQTTQFDAQGRVVVKATCPVGSPQVLGVLVSPIGNVFGLDNSDARRSRAPAARPLAETVA